MKKTIKRIKPPKFKVGRYVLNEYEVRCLQVEVARGERESGMKVMDENGVVAEIRSDGVLTEFLKGFDINSVFALELIRIKRQKQCR